MHDAVVAEGIRQKFISLAPVMELARLVEDYARRPQVQERLTMQIADALMDELNPDRGRRAWSRRPTRA
jgi:GTP cyclohydrolase I